MTKGLLIISVMAGTAAAIVLQGLIIAWRTRGMPSRGRWAGHLLMVTAGATIVLGIAGLEFALSATTEHQFMTQQIGGFDPGLLQAQVEALLGTVLLMAVMTRPLLAPDLFRRTDTRTSIEAGAAIYGALVREHWLIVALALAGLCALVSTAQVVVLAVEFTGLWLLYALAARLVR